MLTRSLPPTADPSDLRSQASYVFRTQRFDFTHEQAPDLRDRSGTSVGLTGFDPYDPSPSRLGSSPLPRQILCCQVDRGDTVPRNPPVADRSNPKLGPKCDGRGSSNASAHADVRA